MLRSSQIRVNGMPQRSFMGTILGSRTKNGVLNLLVPILIGMAIGILATFILKFVGGRFSI